MSAWPTAFFALLSTAVLVSAANVQETVAVGSRASLADVSAHTRSEKRLMRKDDSDPGPNAGDQAAGSQSTSAATHGSGPDLFGALQFSYIDVGNGNGTTYLTAGPAQNGPVTPAPAPPPPAPPPPPDASTGDGAKASAAANGATAATLLQDDAVRGHAHAHELTKSSTPAAVSLSNQLCGDACNWQYTQSNHSFLALKVKDKSICGGGSDDEDWSCCLKWAGSTAGSALSVVKCDSCSGGSCQWCIDEIPNSKIFVFRPKPTDDVCGGQVGACTAANGCTCMAGTKDGKVDIEPPGSPGVPDAAGKEFSCVLELVSA